jgi:hypothetical protein
MVVDLFIDQAIEDGNLREAQAMLMSLFYIARDRCIGMPVDEKFGLNPIYIIQKYRLDIRVDARFRSNQLAGAIKKLLEKRKKAAQRRPS